MVRRLMVALVVVLALGGCKLRADLGTEVEPDGSGRLSVSLGFDQQLQQLLSGSGAGTDPLAEMERQLTEKVGGGRKVQAQRWEEAGMQGIRLTIPFRDLAELEALQQATRGSTGASAATLKVTRQGEEFVLSATQPAGDTSGMLGGQLGAGAPSLSPDALANFIEVRYSAKLPGRILEHNADRVEDGTLIWNLRLGQARTLHARSTTASTLPPLAGMAGLGALLLVVGAAGAWWLRRRRSAPPVVFLPAPPGAAPAPSADRLGLADRGVDR